MLTWGNFCKADSTRQADTASPVSFTSCKRAQEQQETSRRLCREKSAHATAHRVLRWVQDLTVEESSEKRSTADHRVRHAVVKKSPRLRSEAERVLRASIKCIHPVYEPAGDTGLSGPVL